MTHTPKDAGISWKTGSRNEASAGTSFFREELKFVEILKWENRPKPIIVQSEIFQVKQHSNTIDGKM